MDNSTITLIFFTLLLTALEYIYFEQKGVFTAKFDTKLKSILYWSIRGGVTLIINCVAVGLYMIYLPWKVVEHYAPSLLLALLFGVNILLFAVMHALFYAKGNKAVTHPKIIFWRENIHRFSYLRNAIVYVTACVGLYVCGQYLNLQYKAVHAVVLAFLFTFWLFGYWWQVIINLGSGLPAEDPNEADTTEIFYDGKNKIDVKRSKAKMDKIKALAAALGIVGYLIVVL